MITAKIDEVTRIDPEYLKEVCPPPKSVKIELTNVCNYQCGFCSLRTRDKPGKDCLAMDDFRRVVDEAVSAGVKEVGVFYLGESTMEPDLLVDAITYCKASGVEYVFLTTNGSLMTPALAVRCMAAGLDSMKFSINAADEEQFEAVMGVKAKNMRAALQNLRLAYEAREAGGYATRIYASSIQFDGEQAKKAESLLNEHVRPYVDEHYFLPLYGMSLRSAEIEQQIGYKPTHGNMGRVDAATGLPNRPPLPCWSLFCEAHVRINPESNKPMMSACCFGADNRFDVGDLSKLSFMEAWNSDKMQHIRNAQIRTETEGPDALKGTMCEVCVAHG